MPTAWWSKTVQSEVQTCVRNLGALNALICSDYRWVHNLQRRAGRSRPDNGGKSEERERRWHKYESEKKQKINASVYALDCIGLVTYGYFMLCLRPLTEVRGPSRCLRPLTEVLVGCKIKTFVGGGVADVMKEIVKFDESFLVNSYTDINKLQRLRDKSKA